MQNKTNDLGSTQVVGLNKILENSSAEEIRDLYFSEKEKRREENKEILNHAIQATKNLFALDETLILYKELLSIDPTPENYLEFAFYFDKINQTEYAINYFVEELKLFQEPTEDSRTALEFGLEHELFDQEAVCDVLTQHKKDIRKGKTRSYLRNKLARVGLDGLIKHKPYELTFYLAQISN